MADIVHLESYRTKAVEQRGFGPWQKRFGGTYSEQTTLGDLSGKTLYVLALPGEEGSVAFYELIMGILDIGPAAKLYYLKKNEQLKVIDIHLFLADQARFEMMRRLGWVESYPCETCGLMRMVMDFDQLKDQLKQTPPTLSKTHPGYDEYVALTFGDKESFIRRLIPEALEIFQEKI